ncbi:hypothetical protein CEW46_29165 [Bacillus cereus]|nr:hypothetical protein CEW46_29165 [Bacillus cereus]
MSNELTIKGRLNNQLITVTRTEDGNYNLNDLHDKYYAVVDQYFKDNPEFRNSSECGYYKFFRPAITTDDQALNIQINLTCERAYTRIFHRTEETPYDFIATPADQYERDEYGKMYCWSSHTPEELGLEKDLNGTDFFQFLTKNEHVMMDDWRFEDGNVGYVCQIGSTIVKVKVTV